MCGRWTEIQRSGSCVSTAEWGMQGTHERRRGQTSSWKRPSHSHFSKGASRHDDGCGTRLECFDAARVGSRVTAGSDGKISRLPFLQQYAQFNRLERSLLGYNQDHVTLIVMHAPADFLEKIAFLASNTVAPTLLVISVALLTQIVLINAWMKRTSRASLARDTDWNNEEQTNSVTAAFKQRRCSLPSHESCHSHTIGLKNRLRSGARFKSDLFDTYATDTHAKNLHHSILSLYFEDLMTRSRRRLSGTSDTSSAIGPLLAEISQHQAAAPSGPTKTAVTIAATESIGRDGQAEAHADHDREIEASCHKAVRRREEAARKQQQYRAHEELAKQARAEKQGAKRAEAAAKKQRKLDEQKEDAQHKAEKKADKARNRARKHYLGGMAWGYDPNAGVSDRLQSSFETSQSSCGDQDGGHRRTSGTSGSSGSEPRYYDRVTGKYYRRSEFDSKWGIEVGGPSRTTPPGPHRDTFATAMAEVDKTSRIDSEGLSRDSGASQELLADSSGKGKVDVAQL